MLSRGLLSGRWSAERGAPRDFRGSSPRFQGSNLEHNLSLVEALRAVAAAATRYASAQMMTLDSER